MAFKNLAESAVQLTTLEVVWVQTLAGATPTKGRIYVANGTAWTYLERSTNNGYLLTVDTTTAEGVKWAAGTGGGASTALDNLASVAINTSLLAGTAGAVDIGSTSKPFGLLYFSGTSGTPGTNNFKITGASTSGLRTITAPDRDISLDNITTSTTTNGTGFLKGNGSVISFDGSTYLTSLSGAVLLAGAAGGQTINGGTLTTENLTLRANAADTTTGQVNVISSLEASSTTVGSVALSGGLAVAKRVYALDMTVTNTITGAVSGNAGSATYAAAVTLANDAASATDYLVFANTATGNIALKTNAGITVNPSTATITATTFVGALTGTASGHITSSVTTLSSLTSIGTITTGGLGTGAVIAGVTMTLGSDGTGDMYYRASTGVLTRIATAAQGSVLRVGASSIPAFGQLDLADSDAVTGVLPAGNVDTAIARLASPTFTGTVVLPPNTTLPAAGQVLLTVPTADVTATGFTTSAFVSGYTSSAIGDLVYLDSSAKWQKTDADSTTTSYGLIGMALAVAATDASLLVALPGSFVRVNAWNWTVGATLYLGETPGAMQEAIPTGADNVIRVVGFAVNADYIYFYPSQDVQTTVA